MKRRQFVLLLVVFVSGMTTMAVEMAASRLLAPYFGTDLFIWSNLIGLVLIYLTVGYRLGGKLADRYPRAEMLYGITGVAAVFTGIIPFAARPILRLSAIGFSNLSLGIFYGSLVAVILLFAIPITLLGTVSPYAIRLQMNRIDAAGSTAGSIYALSTVGSILGTFLPVLLLIPSVGTARTFLIFSAALLFFSVIGLFRLRYAPALLVVPVFLALPLGRIKATAGLLHEEESAYNYIQVVDDQGDIRLVLNEGHTTHSVYNPKKLLTGGYWDYFMLAPYFDPQMREDDVKSLLVIGLGAGTVSKEFSAVYGSGIHIDGVEIDPNIISLARQFFDMREQNLNAVARDGRYFLKTTSNRYDVVAIDAYHQPYIPFHLTTKEFFTEVRDHLNDHGVVTINVGRTETDYRLVDALASTMQAVFPSVYVLDVPGYLNSIVVATRQPTRLADYYAGVKNLQRPVLTRLADATAGFVRNAPAQTMVFTDDRAPVERVIDQIIFDYAAQSKR